MQTLLQFFGRCLRHARQVEGKPGRNDLAARLLAADELQILGREHAGKSQEASLRPFLIEEMAMATGAFHSCAEKDLADIRRALDGVEVRFVADVGSHNPLAV